MRPVHFVTILLVIKYVLAKDDKRTLPDDLVIATASSSYQVEGAWNEDGKGENIWDRFVHTYPNRVDDGETGDIACDAYHKTKLDVALIKDVGFERYRFSMSWSRILPGGFANVINAKGVKYYNDFIDELIANGITPIVTLYHWDLPQNLQELGGWANPLMVDWFEDYARVVFDHFGDRVKLWITVNQPKHVCMGYAGGFSAPGVESSGLGEYLCARNVLLAHARVFHRYKDSYSNTQKGRIGITIQCPWIEPATVSSNDLDAAERDRQFEFGMYAHPIYTYAGDFPTIVKDCVAARSALEGFTRTRLPSFSEGEIKYVRGSADFLGLNYYSAHYAKDRKPSSIGAISSQNDRNVDHYQDNNWTSGSLPNFKSVPWGLRKILSYVKTNYGNPEIFITENGFPDSEEIDNINGVKYFNDHLLAVLDAREVDDVNVTMYTSWSLMDNFEWTSAYRARFGLYHVDFNDPNRKRAPKLTAKFFKKLIQTKKIGETL